MSNATYSIVTIVRNDLEGIKRTRECISLFNSEDFEWVVIDGDSTDGTKEFLIASNENMAFVSEPDDGIADAWNKGINLSSGKYIIILNAGDTLSPEFLCICRPFLNPDKVVCSNTYLIAENGNIDGVYYARPHLMWRGMNIPHLSCVVPRKMYDKFGPYKPLKYSMDYEWFFRFWTHFGEAGFVKVDKITSNFWLGGVSTQEYEKSFRQNRKIMIDNGQNSVLAYAIWIIFSAHHFFRSKFKL